VKISDVGIFISSIFGTFYFVFLASYKFFRIRLSNLSHTLLQLEFKSKVSTYNNGLIRRGREEAVFAVANGG